MNIDVSQVRAFHGHMCPGLAIGIRVAEQALLELGERPGDGQVVAIVETNNCAVDAIQFITGCTFGKGNLIHLDYGKNAFRFVHRSGGKAIRIRVRPQAFGALTSDQEEMLRRWRAGTATDDEQRQAKDLQRQRSERILVAPLGELVEVQAIQPHVPPRSGISTSLACDGCGERTLESRLRKLDGRAYCPECLEHLSQGR